MLREWPLSADHTRSIVQLCLYLALMTPNHTLARELVIDHELTLLRLDDDAVEAMSRWLATTDDRGRLRGDASIIGSASKPSFIASVEACRTDRDTSTDYGAWRRRWHVLDRYVGLPGRRERIEWILGRLRKGASPTGAHRLDRRIVAVAALSVPDLPNDDPDAPILATLAA